jgi:Flp pilus assembly protein TadG
MVADRFVGAFLRNRGPRFLRGLRARAESGSAALEFALIAPVFFLFLMGIIETGIIFFGNSTLQYAADDVARQVRTGQIQSANLTAAQFRTLVCNDIGPLLACDANLQIDVETFGNFSGASMTPPINANGNLNPALNNFNPGSACQVAVVRLFYTWHVITPLMQPLLGNLPGGNHLLTASGAFRNEPFSGTSC